MPKTEFLNLSMDRKWLHYSSREDICKLLIDTYRIRMGDQRRANDRVSKANPHRGVEAAFTIDDFHSFLATAEGLDEDRKAERQLFPAGWGTPGVLRCYRTAEEDGWSNILTLLSREDVPKHYEDEDMPIQIRVFSEQIDGYNTGCLSAQGIEGMRAHQAQTEMGVRSSDGMYGMSVENWEETSFGWVGLGCESASTQ